MKPIGFTILLLTVEALFGASSLAVTAQDALDYQKRANRFEGIRPKPVSGFDIELLAAQVDFLDNPEKLGERFHVRFFLKRPGDVYLVVRELDYQHYYWLDKVAPKSPWQPGFGNEFDWPTADVVQRLGDLRISDLGVVARLGRENPSAVEEVAPAVFYQSQFPTKVEGYVFRFRIREDAKLKGAIYKGEGGEPVFVRDLGRQLGSRPFSFKWDVTTSPAAEGVYKLVLSGYLLDTNQKISQVVQFYHRPAVK
jgi:hypothetical protein